MALTVQGDTVCHGGESERNWLHCIPHRLHCISTQGTKSDQEVGPSYKISRPPSDVLPVTAPSNMLPPGRLHFPKVLQPLLIASYLGPECGNMCAYGGHFTFKPQHPPLCLVCMSPCMRSLILGLTGSCSASVQGCHFPSVRLPVT